MPGQLAGYGFEVACDIVILATIVVCLAILLVYGHGAQRCISILLGQRKVSSTLLPLGHLSCFITGVVYWDRVGSHTRMGTASSRATNDGYVFVEIIKCSHVAAQRHTCNASLVNLQPGRAHVGNRVWGMGGPFPLGLAYFLLINRRYVFAIVDLCDVVCALM